MRGMPSTFEGTLISWRGPSPFHFVRVPAHLTEPLREAAALVSYGWGVIPVRAQIGETTWWTSLFPKDRGYLLPVKDAVRNGEGLVVGTVVQVEMTVEARPRHHRRS
jgi:hypothetical protein